MRGDNWIQNGLIHDIMNSALPTILQILPELNSGGVERGTVEITQAIAREGWKPLVISAGGGMITSISHAGGEHILLPVKEKKILTMIHNIGRISDIIRKRNVSVVHARSRVPAWSAYYAAKRCGVPFITTFHGVYGLTGPGKKTYNSIMTRGEKIIAVSRFIQKHLIEEYGIDHSKISVIQRGADLSIFNPERVTPGIMAKMAQDWMLPDEHVPLILMPARLTRWKGHEVLIRALGKLPHRNFLCLMVGDTVGAGEYVDEMTKIVHEMKLEGHVRFVGKTKNMTEAYALADIVVAPSTLPEAFGRVAVEAQAMGKIIVTTDHGGAQETVVPNKTGFLVQPGSVDALAATLEVVLDMSVPMRYDIGNAAISHVWDHFSVATMQQKTIALYRQVMKL